MTPEPEHEPEPEAAEARRLRTVFADTALDITPGPVPLAAVERAGRARRRRRRTGLTACCAVLVTSLTFTAHHVLTPARGPSAVTPASPTASAPPSPRPSKPPVPAPPRIVSPGERVDAAPGVRVWLTEAGKHWSGPDGGENFRSAVDGNLDTARPGASHQSEGDGENAAFHSGVYYGTGGRPVRVVLTDSGGTATTASLIELPGEPGWGVWYATTGPGEHTVTLYDAAGAVLFELPGPDS
ncbi:hypothetical protein [Streptomyces sp. NPDC047928]|uniref:hypothetical protein n=1 Tax=unclassified Streptomyces TaxID=2593676 RepID=UPI003718E023